MRSLLRAIALLVLVATASAAAAIPRPAPAVRTLPNGLRVVVLPRTGLPLVQVQLQVPAGLSAEGDGQAGLAWITAQSLRQGTSSRSADDFATELDTLGATFAVNVTRDAAQVVVGARRDELSAVLELMSDAVINPLFDEDAFQLTRRQVATQLGQAARTPATLADERFATLVFGAHPYAHPLRGELEVLVGTTREHARTFHRDHWRPDRALLVIAGDLTPSEAFAQAEEWFVRWSGKALPVAEGALPAVRRGTWLEDLATSPVVEVRLGLRAPGRGAAAFASWQIAREALEHDLLPAEAHATLTAGRDASVLVISASARPESTAVVTQRLRRAMAALGADTGIWSAARTRAIGAWAMSLETLGQWSSSWLAGAVAGLDDDHLQRQADALATASAGPVLEALREGTVTLLSGPAARMKGRLAGLGRVDTLTADGVSVAQAAEAAKPITDEMRQRGRQWVGMAVQAHGGLAHLKTVYVSLAEFDVQLTAAGRVLTSEQRELRVDPDRFVSTTRIFDFETRQVLDRDRGWLLSTAGDSASIVDGDSTMLGNLRAQLEGDLVHVLRAASAADAAPVATGKAVVDRTAVERVEYTARNGARMRLSLDAETHRVVAVEAAPNPQGDWRDRRRWSDYAQLEGVWWPRQSVREIDGQEVQRSTLRRLTVNGDVDTVLFRRPLVVRGQIRAVE